MFRNRRRGVRSPRLTRNVSTPKRPRRRGNTLSKIATPPARAARKASLARKVLDRARRTPPSVARRRRRNISPTQLRNMQNQTRRLLNKRSRAALKGRRPLKKIQRNTKAFLSNFARRRRR